MTHHSFMHQHAVAYGITILVLAITAVYTLQLGIDDFAKVQAALWEARAKWYNIGVHLKVKVSDLEVINAESGGDIGKKFNRMLMLRFKMIEAITWGELCDVLNHPTVNEPAVADIILKKGNVRPLACEYLLSCCNNVALFHVCWLCPN